MPLTRALSSQAPEEEYESDPRDTADMALHGWLHQIERSLYVNFRNKPVGYYVVPNEITDMITEMQSELPDQMIPITESLITVGADNLIYLALTNENGAQINGVVNQITAENDYNLNWDLAGATEFFWAWG